MTLNKFEFLLVRKKMTAKVNILSPSAAEELRLFKKIKVHTKLKIFFFKKKYCTSLKILLSININKFLASSCFYLPLAMSI
jgi:hypothetical protein